MTAPKLNSKTGENTSASDLLRLEIETSGPISFARFMALALYAPEVGYYERSSPVTGRHGDFMTSVSVGNVFGELIGFYCAEEMRRMREKSLADRPTAPFQLVEAGAHDGRLAADVLTWFHAQRPALLEQLEYWIIEPSRAQQQRQSQTLGAWAPRVHWAPTLAALPVCPWRILFCNELLDALPCHRLGWEASTRRWFEWGVTWNGQRFVWQGMPLSQTLTEPDNHRRPRLSKWLGDPAAWEHVLPDGFILEISPLALEWWENAAAQLQQGILLAFDYGLTTDEWLTSAHATGTLRGYARHHLVDDCLADPGQQDLTAQVNFTAVQRTGEAAGLRTSVFESQGQFLTRLAARAWQPTAAFGAWTPAHSRQLQTLIHPEHLGRALRVLAQGR